MIEGDGYPPLTDAIKADILGLNYAAPPIAQRALQVMGWDSNGNVIAAQPSSALVSTARSTLLREAPSHWPNPKPSQAIVGV